MKYWHQTLVMAISLTVWPVYGHEIGGHRHDSASQTDNVKSSADRVRVLMDSYRYSGDDALLDQGWLELRPPLDIQSAPEDLLAGAWLAQAQHHFDMAETYLGRVVAHRPDHGEAWLLRAAIALVRNETETSRQACARTTLNVPMVVTAACYSRVTAAGAGSERLQEAYRQLNALINAQPAADDALSGWVHGVAADLAVRAGLPADAGMHFDRAMALAPSVSLRAAYADLLLAEDRPAEALDVLAGSSGAPAVVLRRLVARRMLGDGPAPADLAVIDGTFDKWMAAGELQHAREMALYYLNVVPQPERALSLARSNYLIQREPEDLEVLCVAAQRAEQAEPACEDGVAGKSILGWL